MAPKDGTMRSVNALLDLLTTVGLDVVDNSMLDREVDRCSIEIRNSRDSLPEDPQAWDRQVEKLVRQLKEALRDAPERDSEYNRIDDLDRDKSNSHLVHDSPNPRAELDPDPDDRRQYLEREFSSTSYPKIGPGYSDSISVVSDLTTPTVMPGQVVPEEEHYAGPPLQIDFSRRAPRPQLRRPSLEHNISAGSAPAATPRDRRASTSDLRPPSRREVTKPGGAAASRRQNHQMTMAHLQATTSMAGGAVGGAMSRFSSGDSNNSRGSTAVPMSVKDFPSLKDASARSSFDDGEYSLSRRESGRRSLLRKSNKYAASVSATASQRMLLARQENAKERKRVSRRSSTGDVDIMTGSSGFGIATQDSNAFGFTNLDDDDKKPVSEHVLVDELGFIVGAHNSQDPFAAAGSFSNDFPKDTFANTNTFGNTTGSFFPAPAKDTKKKKGSSSRRASTGMTSSGKVPGKLKKKDDQRIDAVEKATRKKVEMLRREAEEQGDLAFGSKVDMFEQETMKQIRRVRDHGK